MYFINWHSSAFKKFNYKILIIEEYLQIIFFFGSDKSVKYAVWQNIKTEEFDKHKMLHEVRDIPLIV